MLCRYVDLHNGYTELYKVQTCRKAVFFSVFRVKRLLCFYCILITQRFYTVYWVITQGAQQRLSWAGGLADLFDLKGINSELTGRCRCTALALIHLLNAFHQVVKKSAHGYLHCSISCFSALRSSELRLSFSFFG